MRKILITMIVSVACIFTATAQSLVVEINWFDATSVYYHGLLVLYPNNQGVFHVRYVQPVSGQVIKVRQNAMLSSVYDVYGNCTNYVNCSYPSTTPYCPYTADNFIFYPNGRVFTQDYAGNWSTVVQTNVIPSYQWQDKYDEFDL